jgi:hypothetical protein
MHADPLCVGNGGAKKAPARVWDEEVCANTKEQLICTADIPMGLESVNEERN